MLGLAQAAVARLPGWLRRARPPLTTDAPPAGPLSNTVSILDVAEEVFVLETCAGAAARFASVRRGRRRNPFLGWSAPAATVRGYRLRDVVLDRSLMVLLKGGKVIAETNYLQSPQSIAAARIRPETLLRPRVNRPVAVCFDHWDINYYHWLAHSVPCVDAIVQRHATHGIGLVVPPLAPWQQTSLAMLGASTLAMVTTEPGWKYHFAELEYYDYTAGRADYSVSARSQAAYQRMAAGIAPAATPARRIYIDRTGTANRRIPNEAALIDALRRRGFHIVRPERLDMATQIALFRSAGLVVGQMGAGLANIAFCGPGTVVYELLPEHHQNPCFVAMALQAGLDYWADVFPTGIGGDSHTTGWARDIDIKQVLRRIEELQTLMPPDRRG